MRRAATVVAAGLLLLAVSCNGDGASGDPPPIIIDVASDEELARLVEHFTQYFTELNRIHEDFEARVEGLFSGGPIARPLKPEEWIALKALWGNLRDDVGILDPPAQVEDAHNELGAAYGVAATLYAELAELSVRSELSEQGRDRLDELEALFEPTADRAFAACEELRSAADAIAHVASRAGIDVDIEIHWGCGAEG